MGIEIEFNPDLALRNKKDFPNRLDAGLLPEIIEEGKVYYFLKKGQRNYWLEGEIPLLETKGNGRLSRPLASIVILEATHFLRDFYSDDDIHTKKGEVWTKGKYEVIKMANEGEILFESYARRENEN